MNTQQYTKLFNKNDLPDPVYMVLGYIEHEKCIKTLMLNDDYTGIEIIWECQTNHNKRGFEFDGFVSFLTELQFKEFVNDYKEPYFMGLNYYCFKIERLQDDIGICAEYESGIDEHGNAHWENVLNKELNLSENDQIALCEQINYERVEEINQIALGYNYFDWSIKFAANDFSIFRIDDYIKMNNI